MQTAEQNEQKRDESGRLLADDGYPVAGNAKVTEAAAVGSVSVGMIYKMINDGDLEARRFGRAVRISWPEVRRVFLEDGCHV